MIVSLRSTLSGQLLVVTSSHRDIVDSDNKCYVDERRGRIKQPCEPNNLHMHTHTHTTLPTSSQPAGQMAKRRNSRPSQTQRASSNDAPMMMMHLILLLPAGSASRGLLFTLVDSFVSFPVLAPPRTAFAGRNGSAAGGN